MIQAHLISDKSFSSSEEAFSLFEKSSYGEKINNRIEYNAVETLFLLHEKKLEIFLGKNKLDSDKLFKKFKRFDKKIEVKTTAYADLRKRGYIVKSALKFGAEFRVYDKGVKPGKDHAKWIVYTTKENDIINWHDFAARNRVAHSTKKNLVIAIVDDESDVSYYEISWLKP